MNIHKPEVTIHQIAQCIRERAGRSSFPAVSGNDEAPVAPVLENSPFSFGGVDSELHRVKSKTIVKGFKPFRRLRRNQAAVNESLLAALRELTTVNREMAREIEHLRHTAGDLRMNLRRCHANVAGLQSEVENLKEFSLSLAERISAAPSRTKHGAL